MKYGACTEYARQWLISHQRPFPEQVPSVPRAVIDRRERWEDDGAATTQCPGLLRPTALYLCILGCWGGARLRGTHQQLWCPSWLDVELSAVQSPHTYTTGLCAARTCVHRNSLAVTGYKAYRVRYHGPCLLHRRLALAASCCAFHAEYSVR